MDNFRQYDHRKPRRAKNMSLDEWQKYTPYLEAYRRDGLQLKEVPERLQTEHGLAISYKRLVALVARQKAHGQAPRNARAYQIGNETPQDEQMSTLRNSLDPDSPLSGQSDNAKVASAARVRLKAFFSRSRTGNKTVKPRGHDLITAPDEEPQIQASIPTESAVPADSRDILQDLWTCLAMVATDNFLYDENSIYLYPRSERFSEPSGEKISSIQIDLLFQMADCQAVLDRSTEAFSSYQWAFHLILRNGKQRYSTASGVDKLLQYLLWGVIGYCTTCNEASRVKFSIKCLEHIEKVLLHHQRFDTGTIMVLDVYRSLLQEKVETVHCTSLDNLKGYRDIFNSLHPAIRLREAHFLISIALHQSRGSPSSTSITELSNEIWEDLRMPLRLSADSAFDELLSPQEFLHAFLKVVGYFGPREAPQTYPSPLALFRSTRLTKGSRVRLYSSWPNSEFLANYLTDLGKRIIVHRPLDHGAFHSAIDAMNASFLKTIAEGNTPIAHNASYLDTIAEGNTPLAHNASYLETIAEGNTPAAHNAVPFDFVIQPGLPEEPEEPSIDTSSLSTDTRAFRRTARIAKHDLAMREAATRDGLVGIAEYFSSAMSISTDENRHFHHVTAFPEERLAADEHLNDPLWSKDLGSQFEAM